LKDTQSRQAFLLQYSIISHTWVLLRINKNGIKFDLQRCFVVDIAVIGRYATAVPGPGLALGISPAGLATLFNCLLPEIQVLNSVQYTPVNSAI
jgi:hypothetical protein